MVRPSYRLASDECGNAQKNREIAQRRIPRFFIETLEGFLDGDRNLVRWNSQVVVVVELCAEVGDGVKG